MAANPEQANSVITQSIWLAFQVIVIEENGSLVFKLCIVKTVPAILKHFALSLNCKSSKDSYILRHVKNTESCEVYESDIKYSGYSGCSAEVCVLFTATDNTFLADHPSLGQDLWKSALDNQFTDITFKVGQREFAAHKAIACARSPVFARMFDTDMVESRTGIVEIDDIDPDVFEEFLRFLYTNLVKDDETLNEMREKLLAAAEKYQVSSLKQVCSSAFNARITSELLLAYLQ